MWEPDTECVLFSLHSLSMLGRAGVPGSNDLETALRNLSMKKANDINDQQFLHDREDKKKALPER